MRTITYDDEADLGALARRAYRLGASPSAERVDRAERALLQANPALADLGKIDRGTTILVPEVAGVQAKVGAKPLTTPVAAGLDALVATVERLGETVAQALERDHDDALTAADQAAGGPLREKVEREGEEFVGRLDEVVNRAQSAAEEIERHRQRYAQAFEAAARDLGELQKRLS